MTATSLPRNTPSAGLVPGRASVPIAADTLCLQGTIATKDSDGRAANVGAGLDAIGVYSHTFDNRTSSRSSSGAAGEINAEIEFGVFELLYTGTAPKMGEVLFNVDNQTVSTDSDSGTRGVTGFATQPADVSKGTVQVWVGPHASGAWADAAAAEAAAEEAGEKADNLAIVEIPIPLTSFRLAANGAAIPTFDDGNADGFAVLDNEALALRVNPEESSPVVFAASVKLPDDLDASAGVTLKILASRVGAADTTAAITPVVYRNRPGVAYDAGSALTTGNTAALAGATKVVTELSKAVDQNSGAAAGDVLTVMLNFTTALDADDGVIHAVWLECTRDNLPA